MKNKNKSISILIYLIIIWGFFSIVKFNISDPTHNFDGSGESFNVKTSSLIYTNTTVISDGFGGIYWNDDDSTTPSIAIDNSGNIHVVWYDDTDGPWGVDTEIMYANYSSSAGWSNVSVISDGLGGTYWNDGSSYWPSIATDNSGNIHVVWQDDTDGPWGGDTEIMYTNYSSSFGWSNVTVISDGFGGTYWNDGDSDWPSIATDNSGNIHVVWYDDTDGPWGTDWEIMYANYSSSAGWSNATVISDGFGGTYWNDGASYTPSIATDNNGNIHVVWLDLTTGPWGVDPEIMYASYSSSAGWSNATVISDGFGGTYWNDGSSYEPSITTDNNGNIYVVWVDTTIGPWGHDTEIMYASYFSTAGWSNATVISDGFGGTYWNDGNSYWPSITTDNSGNIHVVWQDDTDGPWGGAPVIMYASYSSSAGWSNATVISDGFGGIYWHNGGSAEPSIATDNNRNFHVVWVDGTDGPWGVDTEIMYTLLFEVVDSGASDNTIMIIIIVMSIVGVVGVGIAIFVLRKKNRAITGE